MSARIQKSGLALAALALLVVASGASRRLEVAPGVHEGRAFERVRVVPRASLEASTGTLSEAPGERPFKLKAAGQVDFQNPNGLGFDFSGVATHLGKYTAQGIIDLGTGTIVGTFTAADGDTIDWTAQFSFGPLGEIEATFTCTGGTGRFEDVTGGASGIVSLDADFMFTFTLEGAIDY